MTTSLAASGAILADISSRIEPGEVLGVVGESGCGKSMLALSIMGLLPRAVRLTAGRILLDGEDLARAGRGVAAQRGRDLAMIFQEPMTALNPVMRVGRQVAGSSRSSGAECRPTTRGGKRSPCSGASRSRARNASSTPIRTKCPAACASA